MLKSRIYIIVVVLMSLTFFTNCGEDDTSITTISGSITNHQTADVYLEFIYSEIANRDLFLDGLLVLPLLYSDECKFIGTSNSTWTQASAFNMDPDNARLKDVFLDFYSINSAINSMFTQLDTITHESLTETVVDGLNGEARAIRGLLYMYLMNYWGEVPLITYGDEVNDSLQVGASLDELFTQIEEDFKFGADNISKNSRNNTNQRINEYGAKGLLARLYLNHGDYALAKQYADDVINNSGRPLETSINGIYSLGSTENVWVFPEEDDDVSIGIYFLQNFANGQHVVVPRANDYFEANDKRRNVALSQPGTTVLKYDDVFGNSDPIYMVRTSEMYLIAAEAACRINGDYDGAEVYLNALRTRAGLSDVELNAGNFEDVILAERKVELSFEGAYRWLDLKRTGKDVDVLGGLNYTATDAYWPFPTVFLDVFKSLEQNDGY